MALFSFISHSNANVIMVFCRRCNKTLFKLWIIHVLKKCIFLNHSFYRTNRSFKNFIVNFVHWFKNKLGIFLVKSFNLTLVFDILFHYTNVKDNNKKAATAMLYTYWKNITTILHYVLSTRLEKRPGACPFTVLSLSSIVVFVSAKSYKPTEK